MKTITTTREYDEQGRLVKETVMETVTPDAPVYLPQQTCTCGKHVGMVPAARPARLVAMARRHLCQFCRQDTRVRGDVQQRRVKSGSVISSRASTGDRIPGKKRPPDAQTP